MEHDIQIENQIRKIIESNPKNYIKVISSRGFRGRYKDRQYLVDYIDSVTKQMCDSDFKYSLKTKIYWVLNGIDSWNNDLVCCQNDHVPIKEWNIKHLDCGYKKGCCRECERAIASRANKEGMLKKYGVSNSFQIPDVIDNLKARHDQIQEKRYMTRKLNNTMSSSKQEDLVFEFLCKKYGESDVLRQFTSDEYPFACDFFIKSLKMYIECNFSWTHGGHWYDENSEEDQETLAKWSQKRTQYFSNAIETWTVRDVKKREAASSRKLNFKVYWSVEEALEDILQREVEYTRRGNVFLMSTDEANKMFLESGKKAFETFTHYDFPYVEFSSEKAIQDLKALRDKDLSDKHPSYCIRSMFKSRYSCIHSNTISPTDFWNQLRSNEDLKIWKKIYVNRLRNDQSSDGDEFRKTGIPSAKVVLSGINVSGLSKIPTYLKPSLAKRLIQKYLSTFDEVFCPFNGFGGIMLGAAVGCNKSYIGQDINKRIIEETQQLIQFIKKNFDQNIKAEVHVEDIFSDSEREYQCLFTCPPYLGDNGKNIEMWNFDSNMNNIDRPLTCDQWIDECLKRYSCKRYLFVVDDKIQKYRENVVEALSNRSHFGSNNEYVILIKRD